MTAFAIGDSARSSTSASTRRETVERDTSCRSLSSFAVAAFGAGRILGLDRYVENYDLGGETLVERYPALEYVLG